MPHLYLDRRKSPPVWRFQIWAADGRRKSFTGTTSRRETVDMAIRRQAYEKELRGGLREEPKNNKPVLWFADILSEYLAWGNSQGGRGGRPWGKVHGRMCASLLRWWRDELSLRAMADLKGILPRVEKALRRLQDKGLAGKTVFHYAMALRGFCTWAENREYLDHDPLKRLGKLNTAPKSQRRAMTAEEIRKLLGACAEHRRLLYETAFCTGLRAGELRSLRIKDLDVERGGLVLDPAWTKNRKPGFQPLPAALAARLAEAAVARLAEQTYEYLARRSDHPSPVDPLLYVPSHPGRDLECDLEKARIPKTTAEGKLDFHACRVAYITHLVESGADVKTIQELARHSDPRITMAIYAKARTERLANAAELVGRAVLAG